MDRQRRVRDIHSHGNRTGPGHCAGKLPLHLATPATHGGGQVLSDAVWKVRYRGPRFDGRIHHPPIQLPRCPCVAHAHTTPAIFASAPVCSMHSAKHHTHPLRWSSPSTTSLSVPRRPYSSGPPSRCSRASAQHSAAGSSASAPKEHGSHAPNHRNRTLTRSARSHCLWARRSH